MAPKLVVDVVDPRTNLGAVLLELGAIPREKLENAIYDQLMLQPDARLGSILVHMHLITPDDLDIALGIQTALREKRELDAQQLMQKFQTARLSRVTERSMVLVDDMLRSEGITDLDRLDDALTHPVLDPH